MGGHNQGLPARSSVKTAHRTVFRALRTPIGTPLGFASRTFSRAYRPVLAENRPLACFPGAANPGRQRRKVCIFALAGQAPLRKNTLRGVHAAAADFTWRGCEGPEEEPVALPHRATAGRPWSRPLQTTQRLLIPISLIFYEKGLLQKDNCSNPLLLFCFPETYRQIRD